jgi:TonB family protein
MRFVRFPRSVVFLFTAFACLLVAGCGTPKREKPVEDVVVPPVVIRKVDPVYPPELKAAEVGGQVDAVVHVTEQGTVDEVTIVGTTNPDFEVPSVEALKQWIFKPGTCNGKPIDFRWFQTLRFNANQPQATPKK